VRLSRLFLAMMSLVFAEHAPAAETKTILVFGDQFVRRLHAQSAAKLSSFTCKKTARAGLNFQ